MTILPVYFLELWLLVHLSNVELMAAFYCYMSTLFDALQIN